MAVKRGRVVQYWVATIVSLTSLASGAWLAWPSPTIKRLQTGETCCRATVHQIAIMISIMDFGNIISPIPASYLVNMFGRKPVIQSTAIMFLLTSALVMLADNMWYLYAARTIAGLAKGIAFGVVPLFIAEVAEVNIRGALCTTFGISINFGLVYDYFFGAVLYEYLNIFNLLIAMVMSIGFFMFPESPYYLVMKGKIKSAKKNLRFYRQLPEEDEELKNEMELIKTTIKNQMDDKSRFIDVATSKSRRRALYTVFVAAIAQRLGGMSPLLSYSTAILPETGGGASRETYFILFSLLMLIGNCFGLVLVDRWGRKKLILTSILGCALVDAVIATFYATGSTHNWIPYASLLLFGFVWALGLAHVPSILVAELFPTNIKTYASSLTSIIFAVASLSINEMFGELYKIIGIEYLFFFFFGASTLCAVFLMFYQFETKGKTFQEIQDHLKRVSGEVHVDKKDANVEAAST